MTHDTAVFYQQATCEGLQNAVLEFESRETHFVDANLRARADLFSKASFREAFEQILLRASLQATIAKNKITPAPLTDSATRTA
jgi:hypothetical protein